MKSPSSAYSDYDKWIGKYSSDGYEAQNEA